MNLRVEVVKESASEARAAALCRHGHGGGVNPLLSARRYLRILTGWLFLLGCLVPTSAQPAGPRVVAEGGGVDDRGSARVLYWNVAKNQAAGQFAIDYGRPVWKSTYEDPVKFDQMTKGKVWRMGSNFWTTLDTSIPLKISGREVRPGYYYLALQRSADGASWSLVFIDPAKVRGVRLDAFEVARAPIWFEIPITITKPAAKPEQLTLGLSYPKENIRKVTLTVAWGNLALTAPVEAEVAE